MPKISVLIITLNEERNIQRCLNSLTGVADEIVVLDSGSADNTATICKLHGIKFITTEWKGYAATKNQGHDLVQHDYVLSIDADEVLSEDLKTSILQHKDNLTGAYRFSRLTSYCGKFIRHGGWYPDKKIRLYDRRQASWVGEHVHEELKIQQGVKITDLAGDLLHYSYYSIEEHIQRSEKYARLSAEKIAAKDRSVGFKKLFAPCFRFFRMYLLKAGFLDGYYGFKIAMISAREVKLKYHWAQELIIQAGVKNSQTSDT